MNFITLLMVSIGLAMDAFAVSITNGITHKKNNHKMVIFSCVMFGVFQAIMPFIGYILGIQFTNFISQYDHWVAFILLSLIGGKAILDSIHDSEDNEAIKKLTFNVIIMQSIATSIDALAVGISYAMLNVNIIFASIIIGITTFIICIIGVKFGKVFGNMFKNKAEVFGGVVLILIGLKILLQHTIFS